MRLHDHEPNPEQGSTTLICLFGAAPDTPNLGVTALHDSVIQGLRKRLPESDLLVFDFGRGLRKISGQGRGATYRYGALNTRRRWLPESLWNLRLANRLGGAWNVGARRLRAAAAVLDLSAGDSFSDIYGHARFDAVATPKRMALEAGVPLVLLPQTYGPFRDRRRREEAARLVRGAAFAWARDPYSFVELRELCGDGFDPERHLLGVDVAFGLPTIAATPPLSPAVESWLGDRNGPVVGVNVSGLIYLDHVRARDAFALKVDYRKLVHELVARLLARPGVRVVLIPHVLSASGHYESDHEACQHVARVVGTSGRLAVLEPSYSPGEIKELISRLDWMCGTRMHATIAALSSGVPAAAVAYSPKFQGVFESCGLGHRVFDPCHGETDLGVDFMLSAFDARDEDRRQLSAALVMVRRLAEAQLDAVATFVSTSS